MEELLRTTNPVTLAMATALLRGEGIECFEMDVHMSVLEGSVGVLPRRLMIRSSEATRAKRVLDDNEIPLVS